jgi:signal transduction histidine kinase
VISGQRAERLSTAVRAALESLVRFDERDLDDASFFAVLATKIAEAVGATKSGVGILEREGLRMRGSHGFSIEVAESVVVPVEVDGTGIADRIVFGDGVYSGDLQSDPELEPYRGVIQLLGVRDAAAVGWRAGDVRLGVLVAFDSKSRGGFGADDVLVLQLAADVSAFVYLQRIVRKRDEILLALSDELSRLSNFAEMAEATARAAALMFSSIECGIVEVPAARPHRLRTIAVPGGAPQLASRETAAEGTGAATVIATGRPIETDDLEQFSVHGATLKSAGYKRVRYLPVTAGRPLPDGRTALGAIAFLSRSRQPFSQEDRRLMDDLARRLGLLAHRAELLQQEAEASAGLRAALDAAIDIGSSLDPPRVIQRLLQRATEALAADRATLSSIQGDDLIIEGSYAVDGSAFEVGRRFRYASSPQFMHVLRTRQPLHETYNLSDVDADARQAMVGFQHAITVPIVEADVVVASVTLSRRTDRAFTPADGRLLELVTAAAGIALQNARHFQATAAGRLSLQVALDAAQDVAAAVDLEEVTAKLLRRAADAAQATEAVLGHVDGGGLPWALEEGVRAALEAGRPAQVADPRSPGGWALSVPLVLEGGLVGVIGLGRSGTPFSDEDIDNARRLAPMAALLVRNARLLEEARQASRAKSDFLNMAGHELRTPLAVIRGYLSLVSTGAYGDPPAGWAPVLDLLDEKTRELASMVESILTAARLQSGRLQLGTEDVDISGLVKQAVERAGAAAALTGGAVVGRYPASELEVRGDRTQLAVIVDNLLANAIKYSPPPAAVTVTVDQRAESVEVRVADRGRGIPEDQWARIFEEFVRVEDVNRDYPAGTGLGLYIARQLAERYGGSLDIESSEPGRGSTFVLRLPLA